MVDGTAIAKKLVGSEEERATSPIVGLILMVAITVILAAVTAAFVLDLGPGERAPNAQLSWEANSSFAGTDGDGIGTLEHNGGDPIKTDDIEFRFDDGNSVVMSL